MVCHVIKALSHDQKDRNLTHCICDNVQDKLQVPSIQAIIPYTQVSHYEVMNKYH